MMIVQSFISNIESLDMQKTLMWPPTQNWALIPEPIMLITFRIEF